MFTKAYTEGEFACKKGKSINYNPYRNQGSGQNYTDWEKGWKAAKEREDNEKSTKK